MFSLEKGYNTSLPSLSCSCLAFAWIVQPNKQSSFLNRIGFIYVIGKQRYWKIMRLALRSWYEPKIKGVQEREFSVTSSLWRWKINIVGQPYLPSWHYGFYHEVYHLGFITEGETCFGGAKVARENHWYWTRKGVWGCVQDMPWSKHFKDYE